MDILDLRRFKELIFPEVFGKLFRSLGDTCQVVVVLVRDWIN